MNAALQIDENRQSQKYSRKVQAARICWGLGRLIFRLIPRPLYGLRNALLRLFGARIGRNVHISNSAIIYFPWEFTCGDYSAIGDGAYLYNLGPLTLGTRVTVSHRAHLCGGSHDYRDPALPLLKCPIRIEDDAWVCSEAFVGPNVVVGRCAVVGARPSS